MVRPLEIRDTIDRFQTLKKKCSQTESTSQDIKGMFDEIRDEVTEDLNQITAELSKGN